MGKKVDTMSEENAFTHITVSDDEADDVVVQAGAVPAGSRAQAPVSRASATVGEAPQEAASGEDSELVEMLQNASEEDRKAYARHMRNKELRERDAYITSEEDLHVASPFGRMRAIIIVVGVLMVVGAVAYWMLTHSA